MDIRKESAEQLLTRMFGPKDQTVVERERREDDARAIGELFARQKRLIG